MTCWVLCRDTTSGEYEDATEPVSAFADKSQAGQALSEMNAARQSAQVALRLFWNRRNAEVSQPAAYDWRERDSVGSVTHTYFEALAIWDSVNGEPPKVPPTHSLVEVPLL